MKRSRKPIRVDVPAEDVIDRGFMKSSFRGEIESEEILPFPRAPAQDREVLELLTDSFGRFAAEQIDSERFDREAHCPRRVLGGLGELGLFGIIVPEEHGGLGLSQWSYCKLMELVAGTDPSTAAAIGAHLSIGIKALLMFGTDEQKERFLPSLASGERFAAFALTESGAGSDANNLASTAVLDDDGRHYVLNGTKIWITNGGFADVFTVFARTGVEEVEGKTRNRLTAFLVTRDMGGVSTGPPEDKLGLRASSTTTVTLEDVRVPVENVLGPVGGGFKVAVEVLNEGRLGLAAGCIGGAKALLKESLSFARNREAFGRPISEFEMIQGKFAWMAIDIYVMESMVYLSAALADRMERDISLESAACKVYCSEKLWRIVNEALQINGGNGFMRHLPYERALRDARINLIFEGTNEILRIFTALSGMQQTSRYLQEIAEALRDPLSSLGVLTQAATRRIKRRFKPSALEGVHPALKRESQRLSTAIAELAATAEGAVYHHRKGIIDRQFIQKRVADMATDVFAMAATIARTDGLLRDEGKKPEVAQSAHRMCAHFIERTWRRVRRNSRRVDFETDAPLTDIAESIYSFDGYPIA
jgi:acyl-CoA dehydrogenase family protein 9